MMNDSTKVSPTLHDLVRRSRSYRRFDEKHALSREELMDLVELSRLSPSGGNLQPLKFMLSCDDRRNAKIFQYLAWAGYLTDWPGPAKGERPAAYVVILGDTTIAKNFGCNHGIAAQSMLLGAVERGLGGCMIGAMDRDGLRKSLALDSRYEILLVVALGKPTETIILESIGVDSDVKYWRDADGYHHVPKRALSDLIVD